MYDTLLFHICLTELKKLRHNNKASEISQLFQNFADVVGKMVRQHPGSDEDGVKVLPGLGGKMNGPRAILLQVNNPAGQKHWFVAPGNHAILFNFLRLVTY